MNTPGLARRTTDHWSSAQKAIHWLTICAITVTVPAGFLMSYTFGPSFHNADILKLHILASQIHHTVGFLLLATGFIWLLRKVSMPRPPLPQSLPRWQKPAAMAAQGLLLLLLILIPWSGWTALSALADSAAYGPTHMWFFSTDRLLPRIWTPLSATDPRGYGRFAKLHIWLLIIGAAVVTLHIGAALWHHFIGRDNLLRRMWPLPEKH